MGRERNMLFDDHTNLNAHQTSSKKKKKRRHTQDIDENLDNEVPASLQLREETDKQEKSHKSRKFTGKNDNTSVADLSFREQGTLKRKKKHRRHSDRSQSEDLLTTDPNSECEVKSERPAKKRKKHSQESEENLEGNGATSVNADKKRKSRESREHVEVISVPEDSSSEHTHLEVPIKKKKKKKRTTEKIPPEDSVIENVLTIEPNVECEDKSARSKKKKKRKHSPEIDESFEDNESTSVDLREDSDKNLKSRKSRESSGCFADISVPVESFPEQPHLEVTLKRKKKKRSTDCDRSPTPDILTTEPPVTCENTSGKSKKKKRKKIPSQEIEERLEDNGSVSDGLREVIIKEKSHKKKKSNRAETPTSSPADRHFADIGVSGDASCSEDTPLEGTLTKKKKKHKRDKDGLQTEEFTEDFLMDLYMDDLFEGSEVEGDVETETPVKKKKSVKKKKKKRDRNNEGEEMVALEQPETSALATNATEVNQTPTTPSALNDEANANDDGTGLSAVNKDNSVLTSTTKGKQSAIWLRERDLLLLEEVFPNIRSLHQNTLQQIFDNDLDRIKDAKQKGITFASGRFTREEDELIKRNVEEFLAVTGLENADMLFYTYRFPEKKKIINQIKRKFNFSLRLSEGVHHTLTQVVKRGAKLYDASHDKGRFTEEEVQKLKKYYKIYGNKWTTIGALIGRSNTQTHMKASLICGDFTLGVWSVEEINCLISAVKNFVLSSMQQKPGDKEPLSIPIEKLYKGIPWFKIEKEVKTRNWTMCKLKWSNFLLLRMNNGISPFAGSLGVLNRISEIKWIYEAGVKESWYLNWPALIKSLLGNIPPMSYQVHFCKMKKEHVPDWKNLTFPEIANHLYTETLPMLVEKLDRLYAKNGNPEVPEKRDAFRVGEIFQEYTGGL